MEISERHRCPKCKSIMLKGMNNNKGKFETVDIRHMINRPISNFHGITSTTKYMCEKCGYIEEYADDLTLGLPNNFFDK